LQLAVSAPGSRTIARTIVGGRKQPAGIVFAANLNDPADVGHPAAFRVSAFLLPNNEESNEDADQRRYQKELTHEDRLMLIWDRTLRGGSSGHKQDTGGKWQAIEHFWDLLPIDKQCSKRSDTGHCPPVVHAASWFLTALEIQEIGAPVVGWKAFRLAACGIWPCEGVECSDGAPRSACNPKRNHNAVVRIVLAVGCVARITTASTMVGMGCSSCLHFQHALDNHHWAATIPSSRLDTSYGCYRFSCWPQACSSRLAWLTAPASSWMKPELAKLSGQS